MDMIFFKSYIKILNEKGYTEADKFKNTQIPDTLYKYFPCSENRLNFLFNQELWLAQHETFNDPNEFEFMFIEEDKFAKAKLIGEKWTILHNYYDESFFKVNFKDAVKFMDANKKLVSISCFTTNPNNTYFWSEYAANKNGFCVEYKINRKTNFYPVIYTDEKIEISDYLKALIIELKKASLDESELERKNGRKYNVISEDGMNYISFLYFNYCCKKIKWKNEDEYRIVFANNKPQITNGHAVCYNNLYITANKIFIGANCSDQDKKRLEEIAKIRGIEYAHV